MTTWIGGESTSPPTALQPDVSTSPGPKKQHRACLNCRRKKVRCHGEQPACSFCVRLGQSCRYPGQVSASRPSVGAEDSGANKLYPALLSRIASIEAELDAVRSASSDEKPRGPWSEDAVGPDEANAPTWNHMTLHSTESTRSPGAVLPPLDVQLAAINDFFRYYHSQPYCFFHEPTFRTQFSRGLLPDYLILAVLSIALRYSKTYDSTGAIAVDLAARGWSLVVAAAFNSDQNPTYRLVQAATLLALFDFTACKHGTAWIKIGTAVSLAQSLQMTDEPSMKLAPASREERRRTLWSIYCLDKMSTCGRRRPALFLDQHCSLHLPCSDFAFHASTEEIVPTLNQLKSSEDFTLYMVDSPAATVVVISVLSQITEYLLQKPKEEIQKPPWDHTSQYPAICTQLARLETMFENNQSIHEQLEATGSLDGAVSTPLSESAIFAYVIYQLCYCVLHHPIILRCRFSMTHPRIPTSFLARALESCRFHATELTKTLMNAKKAGYILGASFYGYSMLVSGTLHALFQHSDDAEVALSSAQMLQANLKMLEEKAKIFANSVRMGVALMQFASEAKAYRSLIDPSCVTLYFAPNEVERLYSVIDYGSMSTTPTQNTEDLDVEEMSDGIGGPYDTYHNMNVSGVATNTFYPPADQFPAFIGEHFDNV
ncbi:hypothetical protein, variant [Exophiala mesophila]|uniref:Zn(2)-C6 fungal-type domain-containing protein n=1 Tax=Exophiala mesophila TaxID=212818 RepID=A0A0D1YAT6_EXOME|nr:hypothetical protein, variant [Exophiala mesophila]KIV97761.1 hypothetical protein, variant [Exophiala mesophila]